MINKTRSNMNKQWVYRVLRSTINIALVFAFFLLLPGRTNAYAGNAKYIILMIPDGWGPKTIEATNQYTGTTPLYQSDSNWTKHWVSTFPYAGSYDTSQAWSNFNYVENNFADSSNCATSLYSGFKTTNGRVNVSPDATTAYFTIGERAKEYGMAVGAVSTVNVSHATPGTWVAHNDDRDNSFAIADEGFFGDPNTTGVATALKYGGGHGPTIPAADVLIGAGGSGWVSSAQLAKLRAENGEPGKHVLVERLTGQNGGAALMTAANDPNTRKLAGLFDHIYKYANNSGYNSEVPTLSESTTAALKVLSRDPNGFVLMVEGGAIDWAAHANNMNQLIGEVKEFDNAVQTVIDWVNDPTNDSTWNNTLVIVTADHDCGYLTDRSGVFPNDPVTHANIPIGPVNSTTISKEKMVSGTGGRFASWEDTNSNSIIDTGETVYWYWNSGDHTNSLVPLYSRGTGSNLFAQYETDNDTVRGPYLDNSDVFLVMDSAIKNQTCTVTGSLGVASGMTLTESPIDITPLLLANNATNLDLTVIEAGAVCPAQTNTAIITKNDTWKYNGNNLGNIGTTWKNTVYDDSGWSTGSGIFGYGETYINTSIGAPGQMSVYFRKTFNICDPSAVTSLTFNSIYDDGMVVYINGVQVASVGVSGNPPAWNGGAVNHEAYPATYITYNLNAYIGNLVAGTNIIAVGVYNVDSTSGDLVFDGELVLNHNSVGITLFNGNYTQAQSVDTTGWSDGVKTLEVTGKDATCLSPLTNAVGTFTYNNLPLNSDTLIVSNNTAIASINPTAGDQGVVMQRFQVDSNIGANGGDGQVELASINISDEGTVTSISNADIYISTTSSSTLPPDAVLIGSTGVWNAQATIVTLAGGTLADRTITNGTSKYIYITYDLAPGHAGETIKSNISGVFVNVPDDGAGNVGTSNQLNIQTCSGSGSISILPNQTVYGNPADLTAIVNTSNVNNINYSVEPPDDSCAMSPSGTYIEAENYTGSINQGTGTFVLATSQSGFLGTGYLKTTGGTAEPACPGVEESGKEYRVYFPATGTYKVWVRGRATDPEGDGVYSDTIYFGLDGTCSGSLISNVRGEWFWANYPYEGVNTITVNSVGTHVINIWLRENNYLLDGIYITQGTETPTDALHGTTLDPIVCTLPLFTGTESQAQAVNTASWTNGVKKIQVTGEDATCHTPLSANSTFTYDRNHRPASAIIDPLNGATITSTAPDPYIISGTANDEESVNHIEVSTDGGQTWNIASCPGCAGTNVNWTYSWTLPANGNYTVMSKAVDNRGLSEIPGAGVAVTIFRGGPSVTSTIPLNSATTVVADSTVTINWDRNVDCTTVTNTSVTLSPMPTSWTKTSCDGSQAVFTPTGQTVLTPYTINISTSVKDSALNPMAAPYQFSYTTGEPTPPSSAITDPLNGFKINSSAPNPYVISGTASDNNIVQKVEVSTNGGSTWNPATCSGCGTANATWTYSWSLPADGIYIVKSRATDTSNNVETPGAGNTITVDRTSTSVSSTIPVNGATAVALDQIVTIVWNTNLDCNTVNTGTITSNNPGWTRLVCAGNSATFTTSGQSEYTLYTVTVKSGASGVKDAAGILMSDDYVFSYRSNKKPVLTVLQPDGTNDAIKANTIYNITYDLNDPDHVVTASFYYDTDNVGYDGTAIAGACASASEGTGVTCAWDTTGMNSAGMPPKTYYIYGKTNDGQGEVKTYSLGQITIYPPNEPPTISVTEPNGTDDMVLVGDTYNIKYTLTDPNIDDTVTAAFYFDNDNEGYNGTAIAGSCVTAPEGTNVTCAWNTSGMTPGAYYIYGATNDGSGPVRAYSTGQITINLNNTLPTLSIIEPDGIADAIKPGGSYDITYNLSDPDEAVFAEFRYDTDKDDTNGIGTLITGCTSAPEGTGAICQWNTTGVAAGNYYIFARVKDRTLAWITDYSGNNNSDPAVGKITIDATSPSSVITAPVNGAVLNSSASDPYAISGTSTDNLAVQSVDVSINGGAWTPAECTGCGTSNATWTYSWSLPADGPYTIQSRANDLATNVETPSAGNTVTIDRTRPLVSTTTPVNTATAIDPDSSVTINWNEAMDCSTVDTSSVTISPSTGWTRTSCSGSQAVFTPGGQADSTSYTVTVTTGVKDVAGNSMGSNYSFSYTTNVPVAISISKPDGTEGTQTKGNPYYITYTLNDPDNTVTAALYYDTDNSGTDGTAIPDCSAVPEGTNVTCMWDTTGMTPGSYYIYGMTGGGGGGICDTRTWTGGGASNLASNPENWSGNLEPQDGDDVIFDGTSAKDSDWDINNATLTSLSINSGYSGTITVNSVLSISGNLVISDGKLVQNGNITTVGAPGSSCVGGGSQTIAYSLGQITIGTAGITVSAISGNTTEAGGTATFTVVLDSQPTADVTIGLSSSDTAEGTVSPVSLTFTSANWNVLQTVTVTGVDDPVQDGPIAYTIVTAAASSSDANYNGLDASDVSVTNTDNDGAGITVSPTSGLVTSEAGGLATFTVVLNSQPTDDVTVGLSSDDESEGTVSPASLTFTTGNWSTPQTVTVTGVNDDIQDGNIAFNIVTAQATSADGNYSVIDPADVNVTNTDDDGAGVTVSVISGDTTEAGGTATFTVVLNSQPTDDVTVGLSSDDESEGTVSPASLTFTTGNWSTPQTVTVTGVNDDIQDGNIAFNIVTAQATSADGNYSVIDPADVSVTNIDDDVAGVTVTPISGLVTTEAGGTATFTVVLNSQPTASVTIGLSSDDTTEGTVSPASMTFTTGNWNVPQTVTVTGVNDDVQDGNIAFNIVTAQATSADSNYSVINPADVSVTNTDNDSVGIIVSPTSGLVTTEAGGTATFTVVLNSQPTDDVTVGLSSDDESEGTVSPASLTFTTGNWSTPQTVTVTGVNDSIQDGNVTFNIVTAQATSADGNFSVINPADVSVTNNDDSDTAGISVTPTSGLVTTEAGGTATFTVVLNSQPTADVTIGLSSDDATEGTVSPSSLSFTAVNWSTPQTVTVTGVNDSIQDGNVTFNIVTAQATSADGNYSVIDPADVSVTNNDDSDTAGITVSSISGNTTEAGGTATFTVVLNSQPTADVTIALSSDDETEGTVSPSSLIFTAGNWSTPQTVTVTGVNDDVQDGNVTFNIVTAQATSTDDNYNVINPANVSVTNTDNDSVGINVTPTGGLVTTEAGGTATFTVVLNSQPTADVTIGLSSSDETEGTVSPLSLTFTAGNWSTPQTVTITGVNDPSVDGNISYTIVTAQATSADGNYSVINPADVSVTNNDNDVAGVTVSAISGNTTEAGVTATFTVVLNSQPTASVTIGLSSSDTTEGTVSPSSLTFTAGNWSVPQTVTVTGVNDNVQDGNITFNIVTSQATSSDGNYSVINPADVSVTNMDNDVAGISLYPYSLITTESGGVAFFWVKLDSEPTANVTINLSSSDTTEGTISPASLTFTPLNWNTKQWVTVTGVNDSMADGSIVYTIETAQAISADVLYRAINPADVSVTNMDNDSVGITVTPTGGLITTEAGGTATFTVVLNSEPASSVTIGLSSSDTTEGTVSPSSLIFTTGNWNTPQTVTITGANDSIQDGNVSYTIVTAPATSTDAYNGFNPADVSVTNNDDGDTAGITVSPTSGLVTTEAGGTATFTVVLNSQPTDSVTIGLSSDDTSEGTVSPSSLTFTTGNWSTPQTVTVNGVNDSVQDGNIGYTIITAQATSNDGNYSVINPADVSVTNNDNDVAGVTVSSISGPTTEAGGTATFTVVLNSQPTGDVAIGLNSSNITEGTVSPSSLTFTAGNWSTPQTVTVTGVNDDVQDGNIGYTIITAQATSSDANYSVINPADVSVTNNDNDVAGVTVSAISGDTTEAGVTATFTVMLNSEPTDDVTIGLSSSDTTEGNVSPSSLTFTAGNWSTPQTVTVTGVNDDVQDGNIGYTIITAQTTSADGNYSVINPADVSVTNNDNDVAGVTVSTISGNTTEAGGTATFTVVLNSEPTADVTIALSSDDTSEGTVSPASLTFTTGNWNVLQTVTVIGQNDFIQDGAVVYNIVTAQATSSDGNYSVINPADVSVTNTDDGDSAGITVSTISGNTTEAGGTATFTVVLNSQPTDSVTIALSSDDISEGTVTPASLTFTTGNWNVLQTVTVTGQDDSIQDGAVNYNIVTAQATSSDGNYSVINPADVSVTNTDDGDSAGITVSTISGNTTEAGGTATFTVVLNSQPTDNVTIALSSDDTSEGTVSPASLIFTTGNWNVSQTVTVTGQDDSIQDGAVNYNIVTAQAVSTDGNYSVIDPADVSVTNEDNDLAGVTVSSISGNTTEAGGTASFTVVLNSEPTDIVTIDLSSSDEAEGTISRSSVTFTTGNWNVPQTVTVTGQDDDVQDGPVVYTIITAQATSTDANYSVIDPADVSVTNEDNDLAGVTVSSISGNTTEAGGTASFTVVLNSEPTANVTIDLSSDDEAEGTVSSTSLTFTAGNWSTPQTVTVTGQDDSVQDGPVVYTIITAQATSTDVNYSVIDPDDVSVTNDDNDVAGVTVSVISGNTTEAGGTATFTVVLNSQPAANVSIALNSSDETEGTVSPASLTFTAGDWNVPQTVTVTGQDDLVDDGDVLFTIVTGAITSGDTIYNGLNPDDVSVTNDDNDTAGITVFPTSGLATSEYGWSNFFWVKLNTEPTGSVTIGLSSDDITEGVVADPSSGSLTFTPDDWYIEQFVEVTGVSDGIDDGDVVYHIISAPAVSTDVNDVYNGIDADDVSVTNQDID